MNCIKIFILRKTLMFRWQCTVQRCFQEQHKYVFLLTQLFWWCSKRSDFQGSSFRSSEVTLPWRCAHNWFSLKYILAPGPLFSLIIHIGMHICIIKDKILVPQRKVYHTQLIVARLGLWRPRRQSHLAGSLKTQVFSDISPLSWLTWRNPAFVHLFSYCNCLRGWRETYSSSHSPAPSAQLGGTSRSFLFFSYQ